MFWREATFDDVTESIWNITDINAGDKNGDAPLHWVVRYNRRVEIIVLLLDRRADVSICNGEDKKPFDYIRHIEHLKNNVVYRRLQDTHSKPIQNSIRSVENSANGINSRTMILTVLLGGLVG